MIGESPGEAILVVDRHPGMRIECVVAIWRHHGVPRYDPLGDTPVIMPRRCIAARTDIEAARRLDDLKLRCAILLIVCALRAAVQWIGMELAAVKEGDVARVDAAFHRLQVIAL